MWMASMCFQCGLHTWIQWLTLMLVLFIILAFIFIVGWLVGLHLNDVPDVIILQIIIKRMRRTGLEKTSHSWVPWTMLEGAGCCNASS